MAERESEECVWLSVKMDITHLETLCTHFGLDGGDVILSFVSQAAVWFLSDAASYASGANIRVAGGRPMGGAQ